MNLIIISVISELKVNRKQKPTNADLLLTVMVPIDKHPESELKVAWRLSNLKCVIFGTLAVLFHHMSVLKSYTVVYCIVNIVLC